MGGYVYVDGILVPISIFFTIGYHAYLWHNLKHRPYATSIGLNMLKRRAWLRQLNQANDKKGMLAVQSLRNTLMFAILMATVTILVTLSLGALANNAFNNAGRFLSLGSESGRMMALKYGSASLFLAASFLCSSLAVAFLVDANFLINAIGEFSPAAGYTDTVVERGFVLAVVGNRLLCLAFPLLLWLFGPLPVAVSSLLLVSALYNLDFLPNNHIVDQN
ncbi:hypothetical protein STAS_21196 [Striga asiatica]|uniref:Uncharacterized protein n=1 Tax=Striga asiatica TaxID=4170 RepID=A0A5A7QII0_STRAF|nr:hypothetical protein STAS_21196 [Striga asiatica]